MIKSCVGSAIYTSSAEVWQATTQQDPRSGKIQRTWALLMTIPCQILTKVKESNSVNLDVGAELNRWDYEVRLRYPKPITGDFRITKIHDPVGIIMFPESRADIGHEGETVFEIHGATPVLGINGAVESFEMLLQRQDLQKVDW